MNNKLDKLVLFVHIIYISTKTITKYESLAADTKQTDFVINKQEMVTESAPPLEVMVLCY